MTEEEKVKAEAQAKADAEAKTKADEEAAAAATEQEVDVVAEKDAEIAKLTEERDNYKAVALKRLGKLPADSEFLGENGEDIQSIIDDRIKEALLNKEISLKEKEKEDAYKKALRENSELKLALKNRAGNTIGGDGGTTVDVKDNVFSESQKEVLKQKAKKLGVDPEKFIENAKKNFLARK